MSGGFCLGVFCPRTSIVNLVHMCLRTNIRGGRQFNMFMSEKSVPWLTFLTRQLQRGQDNHCGKEDRR